MATAFQPIVSAPRKKGGADDPLTKHASVWALCPQPISSDDNCLIKEAMNDCYAWGCSEANNAIGCSCNGKCDTCRKSYEKTLSGK